MITHMLDGYGDYDCTLVETQAANIPSRKLYERLRFREIETLKIFHLHYPGKER